MQQRTAELLAQAAFLSAKDICTEAAANGELERVLGEICRNEAQKRSMEVWEESGKSPWPQELTEVRLRAALGAFHSDVLRFSGSCKTSGAHSPRFARVKCKAAADGRLERALTQATQEDWVVTIMVRLAVGVCR